MEKITAPTPKEWSQLGEMVQYVYQQVKENPEFVPEVQHLYGKLEAAVGQVLNSTDGTIRVSTGTVVAFELMKTIIERLEEKNIEDTFLS